MVYWITGTKYMLHAYFLENFIILTFVAFVAQKQELLHRKVCFLSQPSFHLLKRLDNSSLFEGVFFCFFLFG